MQNIETLTMQNDLYKSDGAIGRLKYFFNNLILVLYSVCIVIGVQTFLALAIPVLIGSSIDVYILPVIAGILVIILMIFPITLNIFNIKKRIADIRGTNVNIIKWTIFVCILFLIPIVSLIVSLFLLFKKGKISSSQSENLSN